MPDPDHEYDKLPVEHFVHNTVVAHSDAPKPSVFSLQGTSHMRAPAQTIDCMRNAQPFGLWNTRQFLRGASLNPNGVAHL